MVHFNSVRKSNSKLSKKSFQKTFAEQTCRKSEKVGFVADHEMDDWFEAGSKIKNQYFYWLQDVE